MRVSLDSSVGARQTTALTARRIGFTALVLVVIATACATARTARDTESDTLPSDVVTQGPNPNASAGGETARELHVAAGALAPGRGTSEAPFSILADGLAVLEAGDTLIVHGGTYRERIDLRSPGRGTPDAPITVRAASGERPVVVGLFWLHDLEYWVIDSIDVTWDPEVNDRDEHLVKLDGGIGWVYRNSEVWGAQSYSAVLVVGTPVDFTLTGLYVHDTMPANDKNQDHLIYLNSGTGGGLVEGNLLVGSPNGRAIKVGPSEPNGAPVANIIIRNNTMINNLGPSNVQLAWGVSNVRIERNLMVGVHEGRANVTTYELSGTGNTVADNVGWGSAGVLEPDVGMRDDGGNLWIDPLITGPDDDYRPTLDEARPYGHLAP